MAMCSNCQGTGTRIKRDDAGYHYSVMCARCKGTGKSLPAKPGAKKGA